MIAWPLVYIVFYTLWGSDGEEGCDIVKLFHTNMVLLTYSIYFIGNCDLLGFPLFECRKINNLKLLLYFKIILLNCSHRDGLETP